MQALGPSVKSNLARTALGKLQACAGKKIYIMDIGIFAKEAGVPACNLATVGFPGFRLKGKRALMIIQNHENAHESHSPPFPSFSSYTCSEQSNCMLASDTVPLSQEWKHIKVPSCSKGPPSAGHQD